MTKKIFRAILYVTSIVLFISLLVATGFLYNYFKSVLTVQLKDELSLAAAAVEIEGLEYLDSLEIQNYRLTWIDTEGNVIFDSQADIHEMGNHQQREEIREAVAVGSGSSRRYSETLTEKTMYEAKRLSDGSILRISIREKSIFALLLELSQAFIAIIIIAICISQFLAKRIAGQITEPLNEIDLEHPLDNDVYEEVAPFLHRIHTQQAQIKKQIFELHHKKVEFEQVTQNMKEGLLLLDAEDQILSINPAARELFHTGEACIGREFLAIERKQKLHAVIQKAKTEGKSTIRIEKNEKEYQFEISPVQAEGKYRGLVILAFDISEQAQTERIRREFTANVSHELKTPLQSIIGSAELMGKGLIKQEDMGRFAGYIHKEASRLLSLIEDIIRLSRLDEEVEIKKEEAALADTVSEVFSILKEVADSRRITLEAEGDRGKMQGVPQLLYDILYNLCDNAIKYNTDGGSVKVSIRENNTQVSLKVEDMGMGIPREHQERIFERFYRVDKSHSKKSGGTGLGLSIVKHAVAYHKGSIKLTSEERKGTCVEVIFPKE